MTAFLTTKAAAAHLGVCVNTFRRMIAALPASRRPKQIRYPGVRIARWKQSDLDSAFAKASASADIDQLLEMGGHAKARATREGSGRRMG